MCFDLVWLGKLINICKLKNMSQRPRNICISNCLKNKMRKYSFKHGILPIQSITVCPHFIHDQKTIYWVFTPCYLLFTFWSLYYMLFLRTSANILFNKGDAKYICGLFSLLVKNTRSCKCVLRGIYNAIFIFESDLWYLYFCLQGV